MKKKFTLLLAVLLLCTVFLAACQFPNNRLSGVANDFVVESNGGTAVRQGKYVYFVNGQEDTTDEKGKNNLWGDVVKGGIYRATLKGTEVSANLSDTSIKDFVISSDDIPFNYSMGKDYDDNDIEVIDVERLVPKNVTQVKGKGLFIYNGYIYYTTPDYRKDRSGVVQYTHVDFMRTSLDGSKTLYITTSKTADVDYNIYSRGNKTYLVTYEESKLISFEMDSKRVTKKTLISDAATDVVFAVKEQWYKGIDTTKLSDFVLFTRDQTDDDTYKAGNTVCMASPDGKYIKDVLQEGLKHNLERIDDNVLLYTETTGSLVDLKYTDLAVNVYEATGVLPYNIANVNDLKNKSGIAIGSYSANSFVAQKSSPYNDGITVWVFESSGVRKYLNNNLEAVILNVEASLKYFDREGQEFFYTLASDTNTYVTLYKTSSVKGVGEKEAGIKAAQSPIYLDYGVDVLSGRMFYVVEVIDEYAHNYMKTSRISTSEPRDEIFIGERKEADIKEEE